jgi:hypothetical protein
MQIGINSQDLQDFFLAKLILMKKMNNNKVIGKANLKLEDF